MEEVKNNINSLQVEHDELLIRIAGLSDNVLKEQAVENYQILCNKLATQNSLYSHYLMERMSHDHKEQYYNKFTQINNFINAFTMVNNLSTTILEDNRLRAPKNIMDRRSMLIISQVLNCQIIIKDLESEIIDEIGAATDSTKKYILYVWLFDRYDEELSVNTSYAIPNYS